MIGMMEEDEDGVFLAPPPPPPAAAAADNEESSSSCCWEIMVGTYKNQPEDFVVREIASRKIMPRGGGGVVVVADLLPIIFHPEQDTTSSSSNSSSSKTMMKETKTNDVSVVLEPIGCKEEEKEKEDSFETGVSDSTLLSQSTIMDHDASSAQQDNNNENDDDDDDDTITTNRNDWNDPSLEPMDVILRRILTLEQQQQQQASVATAAAITASITPPTTPTPSISLSSSSYEASTWESIQSLHHNLMEQLLRRSSTTTTITNAETVDFFVDNDKQSIVWMPNIASVERRGAFHRALRVAFPLLQSETVRRRNEVNVFNGDKQLSGDEDDQKWIKIYGDKTFLDLIPSLHAPEEDLPQLYRFRNAGCPSVDNHNKNKSAFTTRGTKRRRRPDNNNNNRPAPHSILMMNDDNHDQVVLRLRPNLTRQERGSVHHLIARQCKDFVTSTISEYPLLRTVANKNVVVVEAEENHDDNDNTSSKGMTTAAIVVRWSPRARRKAVAREKKKKQSGAACRPPQDQKANNNNNNTLCVLQKTRVEHLAAIQHLCAALRCRPSDVGLAGIKDKQAVTFQFCTLRHVSVERARRANETLLLSRRNNIKLGMFRSVDWCLNQGDLAGNRFKIVVRNVKRVKVSVRNGMKSREYVPCNVEHIHARVDRIRKLGFVNYFGEQRLGTASDVVGGVRPYDIGRAMLQRDFAKSIDLLLQGRGMGFDGSEENPELRRARQVWMESGGDAAETLKVWPKGNSVSRERLVLQGVKRYGKSEPLSALQCLPFGVRIFWIHAYQSYVWNAMAAERIRRFGPRVVEGDLYFEDEADTNGQVLVANAANACSIHLTQVVLPLPGYNVQYPTNNIGELYQSWLLREQVTFSRDAPAEATAKGSYRRLVARADNLQVSVGGEQQQNIGQQTTTTTPTTTDTMTLQFDLPAGSYATVLLRELFLSTGAP